jgi:hypothetical protein
MSRQKILFIILGVVTVWLLLYTGNYILKKKGSSIQNIAQKYVDAIIPQDVIGDEQSSHGIQLVKTFTKDQEIKSLTLLPSGNFFYIQEDRKDPKKLSLYLNDKELLTTGPLPEGLRYSTVPGVSGCRDINGKPLCFLMIEDSSYTSQGGHYAYDGKDLGIVSDILESDDGRLVYTQSDSIESPIMRIIYDNEVITEGKKGDGFYLVTPYGHYIKSKDDMAYLRVSTSSGKYSESLFYKGKIIAQGTYIDWRNIGGKLVYIVSNTTIDKKTGYFVGNYQSDLFYDNVLVTKLSGDDSFDEYSGKLLYIKSDTILKKTSLFYDGKLIATIPTYFNTQTPNKNTYIRLAPIRGSGFDQIEEVNGKLAYVVVSWDGANQKSTLFYDGKKVGDYYEVMLFGESVSNSSSPLMKPAKHLHFTAYNYLTDNSKNLEFIEFYDGTQIVLPGNCSSRSIGHNISLTPYAYFYTIDGSIPIVCTHYGTSTFSGKIDFIGQDLFYKGNKVTSWDINDLNSEFLKKDIVSNYFYDNDSKELFSVNQINKIPYVGRYALIYTHGEIEGKLAYTQYNTTTNTFILIYDGKTITTADEIHDFKKSGNSLLVVTYNRATQKETLLSNNAKIITGDYITLYDLKDGTCAYIVEQKLISGEYPKSKWKTTLYYSGKKILEFEDDYGDLYHATSNKNFSKIKSLSSATFGDTKVKKYFDKILYITGLPKKTLWYDGKKIVTANKIDGFTDILNPTSTPVFFYSSDTGTSTITYSIYKIE